MAYQDELLELASDLVSRPNATQAELRRAVSTAYYAIFHLLVGETTLNWNRTSTRNALGRMFDHGLMKRVSDRVSDSKRMPFTGEDARIVSSLRFVAGIFVELQDLRHTADYDNGTVWALSDASDAVEKATEAFVAWDRIRHTDIAQEYLVSLLIRPRD